MTKEQILECASSLPKQQRIALVLDLWDTIDADDTPVTDAQKEELERRIAEDGEDNEPGEDWDLLKAKLLRGEF
jgi:putative addiction module component (TIGR02574 family)